jgi:hypothetical protein
LPDVVAFLVGGSQTVALLIAVIATTGHVTGAILVGVIGALATAVGVYLSRQFRKRFLKRG